MGIFDFLTGSSKSESTVPDWVKKPIMDNVQRATNVANMGYTPYYGPDVAAFTPMQNAAFMGTNQAAAAFGMPTASGNGMPKPQTFAGGIQGYSSAPMYEQALAALKRKDPARYNALMAMNTKAQPAQNAQPVPMMPKGYPVQVWNTLTQAQKDAVLSQRGGNGLVPVPGYSGGDGGGSFGARATSGGFTSIRDMFDGGGAGASGSTFSGGPLSGALNAAGVRPAGTSGGVTIGRSGSLFGGNSWS